MPTIKLNAPIIASVFSLFSKRKYIFNVLLKNSTMEQIIKTRMIELYSGSKFMFKNSKTLFLLIQIITKVKNNRIKPFNVQFITDFKIFTLRFKICLVNTLSYHCIRGETILVKFFSAKKTPMNINEYLTSNNLTK